MPKRQKEVIGTRMWESHSRQWYRQIGMHKYRFRWHCDANGTVVITAEMAIANREWAIVHAW